MSGTIRIKWDERMLTRYELEVAVDELPEPVRAALEAGRALSPDELGMLEGWLTQEGAAQASGAADLVSLEAGITYLGGRRTLRDDDERPLPFVGDGLTIWFAGGSLSGVGGEVTQVTGSLVTLDHVETYDLALADDWKVRPRGDVPGATPGPYGWNPSQEHIERVEAELARQREQASRRRAERSW